MTPLCIQVVAVDTSMAIVEASSLVIAAITNNNFDNNLTSMIMWLTLVMIRIVHDRFEFGILDWNNSKIWISMLICPIKK